MGSAFLTGIAIILTDLIIEEASYENVLIKVIGVIIVSCIAFYIPVLIKFLKKNRKKCYYERVNKS